MRPITLGHVGLFAGLCTRQAPRDLRAFARLPPPPGTLFSQIHVIHALFAFIFGHVAASQEALSQRPYLKCQTCSWTRSTYHHLEVPFALHHWLPPLQFK